MPRGNVNITRKGDASAGAVTSIAVGTYGPTAAVTHVGTGSNQLKLILWTYLDQTNIVRGVDLTAYPISDIVAASPYVTAARDDNSNIRVSLWLVTVGSAPGGGIINHLGEGFAGTITHTCE
jgi:hypothetical protein